LTGKTGRVTIRRKRQEAHPVLQGQKAFAFVMKLIASQVVGPFVKQHQEGR
jgi:hypothetical protein